MLPLAATQPCYPRELVAYLHNAGYNYGGTLRGKERRRLQAGVGGARVVRQSTHWEIQRFLALHLFDPYDEKKYGLREVQTWWKHGLDGTYTPHSEPQL